MRARNVRNKKPPRSVGRSVEKLVYPIDFWIWGARREEGAPLSERTDKKICRVHYGHGSD